MEYINIHYAALSAELTLAMEADEVRRGEVVLVKPGDRIPVDGVVVDRNNFV